MACITGTAVGTAPLVINIILPIATGLTGTAATKSAAAYATGLRIGGVNAIAAQFGRTTSPVAPVTIITVAQRSRASPANRSGQTRRPAADRRRGRPASCRALGSTLAVTKENSCQNKRSRRAGVLLSIRLQGHCNFNRKELHPMKRFTSIVLAGVLGAGICAPITIFAASATKPPTPPMIPPMRLVA